MKELIKFKEALNNCADAVNKVIEAICKIGGKMELFNLRFNKEDAVLLIEPKKQWPLYKYQKDEILKNGIIQFNDCTYLAVDRAILRKKAKEIQEVWIKETEEKLKLYSTIKVKTKY